MDRAGEKLKRVRERLKLTYRQVEEASQGIAERRGSGEFGIALSRLADIENKGTLPTIHRLYSLCAIYRLELEEVLRWYGVPVEQLSSEALQTGMTETNLLPAGHSAIVTLPQPSDGSIDLDKTTFLSQFIRRWGKQPFSFLNGLNVREYRYGWIGLEDTSMHPLIPPGSVVVIDENRRKIATGGWNSEYDRPIYFLELRDHYCCGWCTLEGKRLILEPHPGSEQPAASFEFQQEIDVIGQVIGVAMPLEARRRRRAPSAAARTGFPDR